MKKNKSLLCITLCLSLVLGLFSTLLVEPVQAKSSRTAKIMEVKGTVHIKKAGGSKSFRAYKNMNLNQGDHISTEARSSVVLTVLDRKDEITIGANSDLYVSELRDKSNSKKSKLSMTSGSMWVKASSLTGSDEFEIETPTAIMGVRGTNLFVGVDPVSGGSTFFIASGNGAVKKRNSLDYDENSAIIYPSQQIKLYENEKNDNLNDFTNIIDIDSLINQASPEVIEAIIKNKAVIDQENAEFIEQQRRLLGQTGSDDLYNFTMEDMDRIQKNLDNMVSNIVKNGLDQKKLDSDRINDLINQINQQLDKPIDLDNVQPLELSPEEQERLEQLLRIHREREAMLEQQKQNKDQLKQQNQDLINKLNEQRERQIEENRKTEEKARDNAIDRLLNSIQNQTDRNTFLANQQAIEQQKQEQEAQQNPTLPQSSGSSDSDSDSSLPPAPALVPSASQSSVTSDVYENGEVYGANITLTIKDDNGEPITNLNSSDVMIMYEGDANYSLLSEMELRESFTHIGNGVYTFSLHPPLQELVVNASIKVKDIIISDVFIFFSEYEKPSSLSFAQTFELGIHLYTINQYEQHIPNIKADEITIKRSDGEVLNVSSTEILEFIEDDGLYLINYLNGFEMNGDFEIFVRGVEISQGQSQ